VCKPRQACTSIWAELRSMMRALTVRQQISATEINVALQIGALGIIDLRGQATDKERCIITALVLDMPP
jgi:hypothetical protein